MAWVTPYTDWSEENRFTHEDWNRIAENINYLYSAANIPNVTQNDFLGRTIWAAAIDALQTLIYATGLQAETPGDDMTAETMNALESLIQQLYDRIALNLLQKIAMPYAGDDLFVANDGAYLEVTENYTRGG